MKTIKKPLPRFAPCGVTEKFFGRRIKENVFEFRDDCNRIKRINLLKHQKMYKEIIINHYRLTLGPTDKFYTNIREVHPRKYKFILAQCIYEMEQ